MLVKRRRADDRILLRSPREYHTNNANRPPDIYRRTTRERTVKCRAHVIIRLACAHRFTNSAHRPTVVNPKRKTKPHKPNFIASAVVKSSCAPSTVIIWQSLKYYRVVPRKYNGSNVFRSEPQQVLGAIFERSRFRDV